MRISAEVVEDSVCKTRLTSFRITYPRIILPELNTHAILAKNTESSRAIPVSKRIKAVEEHGFVPGFLGKNKGGMQAAESVTQDAAEQATCEWKYAMTKAVVAAEALSKLELHKQIANRVLEPYTWVSSIVTATEWANYYNLRIHRDAQPEFCELAGVMLEALFMSKPKRLEETQWHLPLVSYEERMSEPFRNLSHTSQIRVSAARCARVSYGFNATKLLEEDVELGRTLLVSGHMSPYQHQAEAVADYPACYVERNFYREFRSYLRLENALFDGEDLWWAQFRWWKMARKKLQGENQTELNSALLLRTLEQLRWERGFSSQRLDERTEKGVIYSPVLRDNYCE